MKRNSQGFIQIIIILVVLALIGGVYYFGTKNKSNVVSEVATTQNWKTFTAKKFNFKYPSDWSILASSDHSVFLSNHNPITDSSISMNVDIEVEGQKGTIDNYFELFNKGGELLMMDAIEKSKVITSLDGNRAIEFDPTLVGKGGIQRNIISIYQGNVYRLYIGSDEKSKEEAINNFDQILSTFKFTN